jgi:hypothetical protein
LLISAGNMRLTAARLAAGQNHRYSRAMHSQVTFLLDRRATAPGLLALALLRPARS